MFYESGICELPLSAAWHPVRDSFRVGRAKDAFEAGGALATDEAGDRLLWAEVLLAFGRPRLAHRTLAGAGHWTLELTRALGLAREGRLLAADRLLARSSERSERAVPGAERRPRPATDGHGRRSETAPGLSGEVITALSGLPGTLALAMRARVLAQMQREDAARRLLDEVAKGADRDHPWVQAECASAWMALRRWAEAAKGYAASRAGCPDWARPAFFEAQCHAALGDPDRALAILAAAAERFPGFPALRYAHMAELCARDRWDGVLTEVEALLAAPAPAEDEELVPRRALEVLRLRALWHRGERARVLAEADRIGEDAAYLKAAAERGGTRARLAVLPLVQERSMCVAASLAMVMRFHGHAADPAVLYGEMSGHEGVHDWQLDRWLTGAGWTPLDLKLEPDAVRWAVERKLPLLVTRSSLLMAHMEVVCGYDDALEEVEGIDPGTGGPVLTAFGDLAKAFISLVAVAPPGMGVPDAPVDPEATLVRAARRAAYAGDPARTRELLDRIGPGGPAARVLRLELADACCTDEEVAAAARALALDESQSAEQRLRGAMALQSDPSAADLGPVVDRLLAELAPFHRRWVRLHSYQSQGRWDRVLRATSALVERGAHVEAFWSLHARALRANGRLGAAQVAQEICLEISPWHLAVVLDPWRLSRASVDLAAERARLEEARALYPLVSGVVEQLWFVLLELGEVAAAEAMLADARRRMPAARRLEDLRDGWLIEQERPDLAAHPPPETPEGAPKPPLDAAVSDAQVDAWVTAAAHEVARVKKGPYLERLIALDEDGKLSSAQQLSVKRLELWLSLSCHPADFEASRILAALPARLALPMAEHAEWLLRAPLLDLVNAPAAAVILRWLDGQTGGREISPGLRFLRARLLEVQGRRHEASSEFGELVRAHQHVPALAHAIDAALQQERLGDARAQIDAMLERRPGNVECWSYRAAVAERLGDPARQHAALERLVALRPYCRATAGRLVDWLEKHVDIGTARAWLVRNRPRYPHAYATFAEATLLLHEGRPEAVTLDGPTRHAEPRVAFAFELQSLDAQGRTLEMFECAAKAMAAFPEEALFVRLAADGLRNNGADGSTPLYEKAFKLEPSIEAFIGLLVTQDRKSWQSIADALIADPELTWRQRDEMIRVIGDAVASRVASNVRMDWLRGVRARHRDSSFALYQLAILHHEMGFAMDLESTLEAFLDQSPDQPARVGTAAHMMVRANKKRALALFERLFQLTGRPSALAQRAALLMPTNHAEGLAEYRRVLAAQPSNAVAIANLVHEGEDAAPLYDGMCAALALPLAPDTQYFLVAAVHVARAAKRPLPEIWGTRAKERLIHIWKNGDGFDEGALKYMLSRWCWIRDEGHLMDAAVYDMLERWFAYVGAFLEAYAWDTVWVPR